jgi:hypothetical protein
MVLAKSIFDLLCFVECCSNYWIPNNISGNLSVSIVFIKIFFFEELNVRLNNQLIGQPLVYDLVLKSVRSHVMNSNPSKSLVLSLHGSTGTGIICRKFANFFYFFI